MENVDQNNSSSGSAGGSEESHHSPDKSKGKKTKRRPKTPVKSTQPNPSPSETEEDHEENVLNRGFLIGRDYDIEITPEPELPSHRGRRIRLGVRFPLHDEAAYSHP